MNTVGIFEAKTKFTALCEQVVETGSPVLVSKRGRPMVLLTPVPAEMKSSRPDILTAWKSWPREVQDSDFPEVWKLRRRSKSNPLGE